jgi:hypothetical protein
MSELGTYHGASTIMRKTLDWNSKSGGYFYSAYPKLLTDKFVLTI